LKSLSTLLFALVLLFCRETLAQPNENASDAVASLRAYALFKAGDYDAARDLWQSLADKGNTTAMINLANLLQQGMGVTADQRRALQFVRKAAELGDARAQYELGLEYEKGVLLQRDLQQAGHWLKSSALQNDADGQYAYAILLATAYGKGLESASAGQKKEAVYWLDKARANGHPDAATYIQLLTTALPSTPQSGAKP